MENNDPPINTVDGPRTCWRCIGCKVRMGYHCEREVSSTTYLNMWDMDRKRPGEAETHAREAAKAIAVKPSEKSGAQSGEAKAEAFDVGEEQNPKDGGRIIMWKEPLPSEKALDPQAETITEWDPLMPGAIIEYEINERMRPLAQEYLEKNLFDQAVEPRLAATVMLVREKEDGPDAGALEVFMIQRANSMEFLPDIMAFPGGSVDKRDEGVGNLLADDERAFWAEALGTDEETAQALLAAAAREVFEECGVLLAGENKDSVLTGEQARSLWGARVQLEKHEISFTEFLAAHQLVLRADLLSFQSHWVTPRFSKKRYNTAFFVAHIPEGQTPDIQLSQEGASAGWAVPRDILQKAKEHEVAIVAPTVSNLTRLDHYGSVEALFAATPSGMILGEPLLKADGTIVLRAEVPRV